MFSKINSAGVLGLDSNLIEIETDVSGGWPGYQIVGLPDKSIEEAKERIRTAWKNSGLNFPSNHRIIINLAPADIRKEGSHYDLPMAIGMFLASQKIQNLDLDNALFVGELALDGSLRPANGILSIALFAQKNGYSRIFIPKQNVYEASLVKGIEIFGVTSLKEVVEHIAGIKQLESFAGKDPEDWFEESSYELDMMFIKGQEFAKRALEIAASGAHNILLSGPPGSGKTLLARTLPSILPKMTLDEALEVTKIYSVSGFLNKPLITERPFRAPHHSASSVALVGGGRLPKPGEISMAHRGVLFLDEFPEFPRAVLENLRQPLEDGVVSISRAQGSLTFPAQFMLVASQNPCPCGYLSDPEKMCVCSSTQIAHYQKKISGPLLDRIDLHIEVPRVKFEKLSKDELAESSAEIRKRVEAARERQIDRFKNLPYHTNSEMQGKDIREFCKLNEESRTLLGQAVEKLHLSARSYHRILKLSRTIADLAKEENIQTSHLAEALQFRTRVE